MLQNSEPLIHEEKEKEDKSTYPHHCILFGSAWKLLPNDSKIKTRSNLLEGI